MVASEQVDLGRYRAVAPIGRGGFAVVYRAVDERLDATVAVKVLAEHHALDPDVRERFLAEGQLLRRVAGPGMITVHDIDENGRGQPFFVMEFADRGDLRTRVDELGSRGHPVTEAEALAVAATLAAALKRCHRVGIVHRDIKPANLLIASDGGRHPPGGLLAPGERLLLADLGFAKDLALSSGLTMGGGTQGFSAPEQRAALGRVDPRTDVYGASALVVWLLSGIPPGVADTAPGVRATLTDRGVSPWVVDAVERGLAREPGQRFDSVDDWYAALDPVRERVAGPPWGPRPGTPTTLSAAPAPLPGRPPGGQHHQPRAGEVGEVGEVGRQGWRRVAGVAALVGVVAAVSVSVGGWWLQVRSERPVVTVLDDGRVGVERRAGDLQLAVFGPAEAQAGQRVELEAAVRNADTVVWLLGDGTVRRDEQLVTVTPGGPGPLTVTVVASGPDGMTSVDFTLDLADP